MKKSLIFILPFLFLIGGCTHNISKSSLALADTSITFIKLLNDPDAFRGKFVILGGKIAAAKNNAEGIMLEVIQHDLDSRELPDESIVSGGRFLAFAPGPLNMTICRSGRLVSMAGVVAGKRVMPLKGKDYSYPVIVVKELHLFSLPDEEFFNVWMPYIR